MPECIRRRIKNETAVVTIEQNILTGLEFLGCIVQSHRRRNLERARHDGGVRSATAEIDGETEDVFAIHRRRIRGRDVVRDEDVRLRHRQKRFRRFPLQIPNDAARHVLDIERAFAEIRIVDLAEGFGVMFRHFMENKFHVAKIGLEFAQYFVDQRPVFDDEQMRIENARVFRTDRFGDTLLHFENLRARLDERRFEPRDLVRDIAGLNPVPSNVVAIVAHDQDFSPGNARRNSNAFEARLRSRVIFAHPVSLARMSILVEGRALSRSGERRTTRRSSLHFTPR